jgi:cytosine deaminase
MAREDDPVTEKIIVYQKPTCSKCIATVNLLDKRGVEFEAIDYYERPLTAEELRGLLDKLGLSARDVVRKDEPLARSLRIEERDLSEDELISMMVENPDLIQRPIVVHGQKAVLGRPLENVERLLSNPDYGAMLGVAIEEARQGLSEGGIPIGAAMFDASGNLIGRGHNRRIQENDPSVHAETDAFRKAGRVRGYRDKIMVTTLAPCWYCSGLIRQFRIGTIVVGESVNFQGGIEWLRENGVEVIDLNSQECIEMLSQYTMAHPEIWNEDIGND